MHHPRLVSRRRQGPLAHPAGRRPAKLAHQDLLVGKGGGDTLADAVDMRRGVARRDREVFPIGQDVDGDEVDGCCHVAVAEPELPHVRVGHRHRHLRFDLTDQLGEVRRRDLAPQEGLVADDEPGNDIRKALGKRDGALHLGAVLRRIVRDPHPLQHLHTVATGDLRDLVEAMIGRVCPHAVGDLLEVGQVLVDLAGIDRNVGAERVLVAAERGVGYTVEFLAGGEGRRRHRDRRPEPHPYGDDGRGCQRKKRNCNAHRD